MKKWILLFGILINHAFGSCLFSIDNDSYVATVSDQMVAIGKRKIGMHFDREKVLADGSVEVQYISDLARKLTDDYLQIIAGALGFDIVYAMDQFYVYAMDLVNNDPNSDLFSPDYRLHGYHVNGDEITMILCPHDEIGVMFAEIKASCR